MRRRRTRGWGLKEERRRIFHFRYLKLKGRPSLMWPYLPQRVTVTERRRAGPMMSSGKRTCQKARCHDTAAFYGLCTSHPIPPQTLLLQKSFYHPLCRRNWMKCMNAVRSMTFVAWLVISHVILILIQNIFYNVFFTSAFIVGPQHNFVVWLLMKYSHRQ